MGAATALNTKITYPYGTKELYIEVPWAAVDYTYVYQFYILLDNGVSDTQSVTTVLVEESMSNRCSRANQRA
jgi:hypothetical protein